MHLSVQFAIQSEKSSQCPFDCKEFRHHGPAGQMMRLMSANIPVFAMYTMLPASMELRSIDLFKPDVPMPINQSGGCMHE